MREFKQFPCTVYQVDHLYKIRKITVNQPNAWSMSTGITGRGSRVSAADCHPTFDAAAKAAKKKVKRRIDDLKGLLEKEEQRERDLDVAIAHHHNPPAKAIKCPPKPRMTT